MAEYLSREDILDIASQYCTDDDGSCSKADVDNREMLDEIEALPAADVQPVRRGRWESSQRTIETGTVYCGNCAIEYYISDLQAVGVCNGIVHYCPNCGARMDLKDGEQNENN